MTVGPQEEITPKKFDVVLNVSDSMCWLTEPELIKESGCEYHWFPINEMSRWGYAPFFWSKRLLDSAYARKKSIGVHCHAGAHRSPIISLMWMASREGSLEDALRLFEGKDWSFDVTGYQTSIGAILNRDIRAGTVPVDILDMYKKMDKSQKFSLMGILNTM